MASPVARVDADAVIGEEYAAFKDDVTRTAAGKLAASKIRFADIDMDGFYNQAWYGLYTKLQDGQEIDNRKGLLVQMTYRRAIDEYRTLHPDRQADPVVLETLGRENPIEETLDQQQEFHQFVEGMRSSLTQRELQAATLCYVYGMSRPEAAERVGVRPKRMEKIMDEVSRKLRPVLASIKEGTWCEDRAVLINQFALGALEPDSVEYAEAVGHLEHCSGCRRHVLGTRGLTAVTVPSALLLLALTGATVGAAGAGAVAAGAGGSAAAGGSTAGAGAGAAAGAGAGVGGIAQAAAVVVAVGAVAAGGVVAAKKVSDDGAKPSAPVTRPASASASQVAADRAAAAKKKAAAAKKKAKKKAAKKKREARKATTASPVQPQSVTPAPPASTPTPAPAPKQSKPSEDSGAEFDLQ